MRFAIWCGVVALGFAIDAVAAELGAPGGPEPANTREIASLLRQDAYDMELLISYGTSKGGSAGHLALAIRDDVAGGEIVYSANYYADRAPEHAQGFYTKNLMTRIPKDEYLFKTTSSLGDTASFGLDFGEIYKRSVVGVRVYNVPASEKSALVAYFTRIDDDYHRKARKTEYHDDEIKYDYLRLNCAKTVGAAFKYGAGYHDLDVKAAAVFARRKAVAAVTANLPTEMAVKLFEEWNARGYGMDVVLYRKYEGSPYIDPHDKDKIAFKDLPNRFPSVLSLDFLTEEGHYEDFDNLYAMYVLYNMGRYSVRLNPETKLLEIETSKTPLPYPAASRLATESARLDTENFGRRASFVPRGTKIGANSVATR